MPIAKGHLGSPGLSIEACSNMVDIFLRKVSISGRI
jgi:hypothetical protein